MAKKEDIDKYLKRAQSGDYSLDDIIPRSSNVIKDVEKARNFQEDALGRLLLEQYKGKVPDSKASESQVLDLIEGLREQYLPDVKSEIRSNIVMPEQGLYTPQENLIEINPRKMNRDTVAGTLAHEGLHARDLRKGDYGDLYNLESGPSFNKGLSKLDKSIVDSKGRILDSKKAKELVKSTDLSDLVEATMEGHHGLKRGGTIGKVNIGRLLKGLPLLGAGAALLMNPEDASAAVPGLSEAETIGESPEEEAALLGEIQGYKDYQKSPARMDKLRSLIKKK